MVEPRRLLRSIAARPDERNGLGGVADIVARQPEQHGIDASLDHLAQDAAERQAEEQPVGERRERPASVWVWRGSKIVGEQAKLVVTRRRISQPVQQCGKRL